MLRHESCVLTEVKNDSQRPLVDKQQVWKLELDWRADPRRSDCRNYV